MTSHESLRQKLRSIVLAKAQAPFWPMVDAKFNRIFPDEAERHEIGARIWTLVEGRIVEELDIKATPVLSTGCSFAKAADVRRLKPYARKAVAAGVAAAMTQIERTYSDFE